MVMSPEERRSRMRRALGNEGAEGRSARVRHRSGMSAQDILSAANQESPDDYIFESFDTAQADARAKSEARAAAHKQAEKPAAHTAEEAPRRSRMPEAEEQPRKRRSDETAEQPRKRRPAAPEGKKPEKRDEHGEGSSKKTAKRTGVDRGNGRRGNGGDGNGNGGSGAAKRGSAKKSGGIDPRIIVGLIAAIVVIVLVAFGLKACVGMMKNHQAEAESASIEESIAQEMETAEVETEPARDYLGEAGLMAAQYDYDGAIDLVKSMPDYDANEEAKAFVAKCEETKGTLVEQNVQEITHVFFHILCVDPVNSFDASKWGNQAGGYNSLMTTIDEFKKMMQEMYDKGYVLVGLHDVAHIEKNADGTETMVKGSIMLPPGKKAFVMSEDDVCYYEYMVGAGYADKMIIGEDGRPTLHYTDKDGNEFVGDYDLLGVLDTFIDEHPDFSYKGHKACLVFTGYNGILGYRTDESYDPNSEYFDPKLEQGHDVAAERKQVVEVLKAVVADGYEVGSHSWGHRDLGQIEFERFKKDCDRWDRNVATLIKEATGEQPDIIIYPKGADVADWHGYDHSNARFDYMYQLGFRYFCNVDSSQYWVQVGSDHMRQGRRALDGYNMWNDIANGYNRLSDLFDNVSNIFDPARPTPVPAY